MKDRKKPYFGSRQNVSEKIVSFDRIYFFNQGVVHKFVYKNYENRV